MTDIPRRYVVPVFAALVLASPSTTTSATSRPEPLVKELARQALDDLAVGERGSLDGYSHLLFMPEWEPQRGRCDTREIVLTRDAETVRRDASCRVLDGIWYSRYDGQTLTSESQLDVDHVVPLANAWRSGANVWSDARRRAFANDLERPELITVSAVANVAKGGATPVTWKPPLTGYWCTYARSWITVKHYYGLRVTKAEKAALTDMLDTCR
jgi:hypothetical protein